MDCVRKLHLLTTVVEKHRQMSARSNFSDHGITLEGHTDLLGILSEAMALGLETTNSRTSSLMATNWTGGSPEPEVSSREDAIGTMYVAMMNLGDPH